MIVETHDHFDKRLNKLAVKHAKMVSGYTTKIGKDGLIRVEPLRAPRVRKSNLVSLIIVSVLCFFAFKILVLGSLGDAGYADRVAKLEAGTFVEQMGAKIMQADAITIAGRDFLLSLLR